MSEHPESWYRCYGFPGIPTPRVMAPILIGGARNGERFVAAPVRGDRLRVPRPVTRAARAAQVTALDNEFAWPPVMDFEIDEYRRLTFASFFMAPVDFWVEEGLSDDMARALIFEHYFVGSAV